MTIKKTNIFKSKSHVLKFLQTKLRFSNIEDMYVFTAKDWENNKKNILETITAKFHSLIIVRSSAIGEDSKDSSKAGVYESILNVNPKSKKELKKAITNVINSYIINGNYNPKNQILIQQQTQHIRTSGVLFTKSTDIATPYYVINYEDNNSTIGVTQGLSGNTIKIFRKINTKKIPKKWKALVKSIKEIENILKNDLLDIEFGITNNGKIFLFQVRPITSINENSINYTEKKLQNLIFQNKNKFSRLNKAKKIHGKYTIFSDMADWNPSEIIGNNPNLLDYSLYDYLIMNQGWQKGRSIINYQNIHPYPLMTRFGNKPYVDVRASFSSLIPKNITSKLKKKLINFYLKKLLTNPHLHDKVEFQILFTCYDLMLDSRLKELHNYGFNNYEIQEIKIALLEFTNNIIDNFPKTLSDTQKFIKNLQQNRDDIKSKLKTTPKDHKIFINAAEQFLVTCKKNGTIPFSTMARIAFIGSILLKSLNESGYVAERFINDFMNSIKTPLTEIQDDIDLFLKKKISKTMFLNKYGHLRPGTYDITAKRYDINNQFFENIKFVKQSKKPRFNMDKKILKILEQHGLKFNKLDFFDFVKNSLVQREKLKFEFTKNLSDALELIAEAGEILGFSKNDLSNLDIKMIFRTKNLSKTEIKKQWIKQINTEKKRKNLNVHLSLPPLIFSEDDFDIIHHYVSKPNFITIKKVIGNTVEIDQLKNPTMLENRIVLIENADPGYDWIFIRNPSGLITKYGGIASHMSIRCAEIGLPAAIGCGEIFYERLQSASKILLDCKNKEILSLEDTKTDEYMEVRKTLKSLGYIK